MAQVARKLKGVQELAFRSDSVECLWSIEGDRRDALGDVDTERAHTQGKGGRLTG